MVINVEIGYMTERNDSVAIELRYIERLTENGTANREHVHVWIFYKNRRVFITSTHVHAVFWRLGGILTVLKFDMRTCDL
jgi:hypothetical protein